MVKKRRITHKDWKKVEEFVSKEYDARKSCAFRKSHETKWKEVDRQLAMEAMQRVDASGNKLPKSWHSTIELGELSKASEIITADVMRIMFPHDRTWFDCHTAEPEKIVTAAGMTIAPQSRDSIQTRGDGVLRSLMAQQHLDFGFKARVELSIKEALHHGSYVAIARFSDEMVAREGYIGSIGAPTWVPFSMWNSFPDPSPSVISTGMFYTGAMILREYMPHWKLKRMSSEGWMPENIQMVRKETHKDKDNETEDAEIVNYFGDIAIERGDGDIYLPNVHVKLANGVAVYYAENDLPYVPIIFDGYERQDIRDPYHTSPLIKQSPMQKVTSVCANKYLDAVALKVEPPIEFDGNDPDYVQNGGPRIAPGASTPTKSMGNGMKILNIGDPRYALEGFQVGIRQMQEGTGVSSIRSAVSSSDRQTATEVRKVEQAGEVRTIDFIGKVEMRGLRTFLYMQHALNRKHLANYPFYNDEMSTSDFVRLSNAEIDMEAHFDVTGSRGVLGEEERTQRVMATTAFFSGNPLFAPKLKTTEIMLDAYKDAGKKNPEEFVKVEEDKIDPAVMMKMQQAQQIIQQQNQEIQQLRTGVSVKMADIQARSQTADKDRAENMMEARMNMVDAEKDRQLEYQKMKNELMIEMQKMMQDNHLNMRKMMNEAMDSNAKMLGEMSAKKRKRKVTWNDEGPEKSATIEDQ